MRLTFILCNTATLTAVQIISKFFCFQNRLTMSLGIKLTSVVCSLFPLEIIHYKNFCTGFCEVNLACLQAVTAISFKNFFEI